MTCFVYSTQCRKYNYNLTLQIATRVFNISKYVLFPDVKQTVAIFCATDLVALLLFFFFVSVNFPS